MANVPRMRAETEAPSSPSVQSVEQIGRKREAPDERALVCRAQTGDGAAYEVLVGRHQRRILAVVRGVLRRSEDAEDIVQQVFIKAYFSLPRFDQRAAFGTWLYKIAVNECWDYLRKKKVRPLLYEADMSEEQSRQLAATLKSSGAESGADILKRLELRQQLEGLFQALEERDRVMLVLKEVEGFSVEEIGETLNLNVNTVKVRLFRARARLAELHRRKRSHGGPSPKASRKSA